MTILQIQRIANAIDIILRENYQSVIACQEMKESLERIDSGVTFTMLGDIDVGQKEINENIERFSKALNIEMHNLTVPGEGEKANSLKRQFENYLSVLPLATDISEPFEVRHDIYFEKLLPLFNSTKGLAQDILVMNQSNMSDANEAARAEAASAQRRMTIAILICAATAIAVSFLSQHWILNPVRRLTLSANEIRLGNLDLVLTAESRDEIGQLSEAFNAMAEGLREIRRSTRRNMMRTRKALNEVFKALPTAIAVLDLDDRVEVSTKPAEKLFGMKPGTLLRDIGKNELLEMVRRAETETRIVELDSKTSFFQVFQDNKELFFSPVVVPILEEGSRGEVSGTAIILNDVTNLHEQQELKRSAVTTVSHQLRNPLTSIRMAVHLLLDEVLGPLTPKQTDMLLTARDESERLTAVVEELLDLSKMETGKTQIGREAIAPHDIVRDVLEPFLIDAKDKGISLDYTVPDVLPEIWGDAQRLRHVLSNLLANALRFTKPGGVVTVSAEALGSDIRFTVLDTGEGIPVEYQPRIFEPFFRVPGQEKPGIGLGLAIVKEIVAAHNGSVGMRSQPREGSAFWFTVPQANVINTMETKRSA